MVERQGAGFSGWNFPAPCLFCGETFLWVNGATERSDYLLGFLSKSDLL